MTLHTFQPSRVIISVMTTVLFCFFAQFADATSGPQRIISLGPINTENIYLLGAGDRLVADTTYCVRPEAAQKKPKIGSVMQVSIEKIMSYRPDLILATGLTQQQQVQKLRALGLNVICFKQPSSFLEICDQFLHLGEVLGLKKQAEEIVQKAQNRVNQIQQCHKAYPPQKVFLQVGAQPLFSSVKSSFTNDFIVYSGGINIAGDRKSGAMNKEQVLAANPDVIIISIMGGQSGKAGMEKKQWQSFPHIKAVQQKRVHIINPDLVCSPSPVTFVDALEKIAFLIHPEASKNP